MTPKMQRLLRLFSITPVFKISDRTRLFIELRPTPWNVVFWIVPRALFFLLYLSIFQFTFISIAGALGLTILFFVDFRRYCLSAQYTGIGFDGNWFLVNNKGEREAVSLNGEVMANGYFVSMSFSRQDAKRIAPLLALTSLRRNVLDIWVRPSVPFLCGSWNLSKADFHALRVVMVAA